MPMLNLLRSYSWRELRLNPWRYLAALVSIALGVALAFSVHVINASALSEFSSALQSVQGQPDARIVGAQPFDEAVYAQVAARPEVQLASPVLELSTYALDVQGKKIALRVLGVDGLIAPQLAPELAMRPHAESNDRFAFFSPGMVFVNPAARAALGGAAIEVIAGTQVITMQTAGTVAAKGQPLVVMDIGAMQDAFNSQGKLSRIDLRMQPGQVLQTPLPGSLRLEQPEQQDQKSDQLSRAYRVNMTVLALVALFTGAFLVYSVLTLAVAKRAQQLALLGVLGLTPAQRMRLVLLESTALGLLGSLLGIALGTALAAFGLKALGGDLGGGYFSGATPPMQWSATAALIYGLLGWAAALAGAWWPARSAAVLPLAQTLKGLGAGIRHVGKPWFALVLIASGAILAWAPSVFGMPIAAYLAVALLLVGGMGLLPWGVGLLYDFLAPYVATRALPMLAVERARRMREVAVVAVSGVVAALSLAVALTVMVSSFRFSVSNWLDTMLPAPLYLRVASSSQVAQNIFFTPQEVQRMAQTSGVERVVGLRIRSMSLKPQQPDVSLIARPISATTAAQMLPMVATAHAPAPSTADSQAPIALYVSEAMVDLHGAVLGQIYDQKALIAGIKYTQNAIDLGVAAQTPSFYIAGIWRDYARQFGTLVIDSADYQRISGDTRINDLAIWPQAGEEIAALQTKLREKLASDPIKGRLLEFASSAEIRKISLTMFDRSFAVTYWLQAVAIGIGLFGVATSFSAQVLARRKEFGLLAHLGLTRSQILKVVALEGAAWTLLGALAGCALGLVVSLVLIHVVNPQSFHWTMDMHIPWLRLSSLCLAVIAAGTVTAWLAGRAAASRDAVLAVKEDW
jgi:putative ABC transport system permease protein